MENSSKLLSHNDEIYDDEDEFYIDYSSIDNPKASYRKYESHEGYMFCIELSEHMFSEISQLNYKVQLIEVLESLMELMSQLVITRPSTGVGCFFFNCDNKESKKRIYEFLPLRDINVSDMKKLHDLLDDVKEERLSIRDAFKFDEINDKGNSLESLFLLIQDRFSNNIPGQKIYTNKKVFLFTDNDKPKESNDKEKTIRLRRLFDDISDNYIQFVTFFINKIDSSDNFDDSFYSDILKLRNSNSIEFDGPSTKPISVAYIKNKVLRKKEIKRIMFQCPLILNADSDFQVNVKGYTIISHEKPGSRYKLVYEHENIRREAFSKRKLLNGKTGTVVTKDDTEKIFQLGNFSINSFENEFEKGNDNPLPQEPFLKLIGFRSPENSLHLFNNIGKALFIVPDESRCVGSIRTLSSMYRTMRTKNRNAIVWGKLKSNSNPNIWILSPSDPTKDQNEGFYLYKVPFLDEIRKIPSQYTHFPSDELIRNKDYENLKRVTRNILGYFNLTNGYSPLEFKNPLLQKYYKLLHDYLLQVETVPETEMSKEQLKQKILEEDDTIRKTFSIRDKIIKSASSTESHKQRLSANFNIWNDIYSKLEGNEIAVKEMKPKKQKN
ncbi:hypothetical protein TPHA_0I00310 [Tetrapisispora phaffii CBS 4417]|uniref:ATP-dependent DNA helicase II subunit 1 n=1 Tax=Tetrapisispora phaffii (strain ATCC 24235 / CBS 4417 / NBRC 1672 / NRRL Y-8282 / UCD 70-5) TaxID=1071381 RepID=G8BXB0_TETPH|nr:hypothetical protein TPHA_0I00310 [Tetrapisispora phaffii CBS 4417]CCE64538.1 hypothetical protein TPHA_0I00310 [Tetrapisispora phaffii CBS 4417]